MLWASLISVRQKNPPGPEKVRRISIMLIFFIYTLPFYLNLNLRKFSLKLAFQNYMLYFNDKNNEIMEFLPFGKYLTVSFMPVLWPSIFVVPIRLSATLCSPQKLSNVFRLLPEILGDFVQVGINLGISSIISE